jgi:hypothetical protein
VPEVEQQGVGGEEAALPARPLTLKVLVLWNQLNRKYEFSVADPDPEYGAFLTPGSGIRDGLTYQDPDPE